MKIGIVCATVLLLPSACHTTSSTPPLTEENTAGSGGASTASTASDGGSSGEAGAQSGGTGGLGSVGGSGGTNDPGSGGGNETGSGGSSGEGGDSGFGGAATASGGTSSFAGGASSGGSAGSGATGGSSGSCRPSTIIDDMEDANAAICANDNRNGGWFVVKSTSAGTTTPAPGSMFGAYSLVNDPRGDSQYGMRFAGTAFDTVNTANNWAYMGVSMASDGTYDASAHAGIRFWAKSNAGALRLRVQLSTTASRSDVSGGTCVGNGCDDHWGTFVDLADSWVQYTVDFDFIAPAGWGQTTAKDLEHLWQIEFKYNSHPDGIVTNPSSFNVLLDDLEFWN